MYRVLIVDDSLEQCMALKIILNSYDENFVIDICTDLEDAKKACTQKEFDLFLLDMQLDTNSSTNDEGIALGLYIRSLKSYSYTPIIYITSVPEKIQDALSETYCFNYILKPYTPDNIIRNLDRILNSPLTKEQTLCIHTPWGVELTFKESDILYISAGSGHCVNINTIEDYYPTSSYTLDKLEEMLHRNFFRVHRKYLVNTNKITSYNRTRHSLTVANDTISVPVGRAQKDAFELTWRKE